MEGLICFGALRLPLTGFTTNSGKDIAPCTVLIEISSVASINSPDILF